MIETETCSLAPGQKDGAGLAGLDGLKSCRTEFCFACLDLFDRHSAEGLENLPLRSRFRAFRKGFQNRKVRGFDFI